ncbi:NAD(P)/FAD-dependent oxidoreductase [Vallitalea sp.]|uniref:NAD(P)/FAD-dependent oxidoreductase n=1 Tax=Vallitalea sp. TaxID=1882829 RepID=UPI0025E70573|nr:NAD(P)/FAD-dependent oxidoreductase [Vallitalea sp.]MCT4686419.1 NAD(P)/FAD-dependent oxidoreductase [Vallitalea sp.]
MYDISIIGAGVTGSLIARQLSKYNLKVCLLDKESDVAMGTSKANSAIVHAGYDAKPGSLKAKFNVRGNEIMGDITKELYVPFKRIGSFVIAFDEDDMEQINTLYAYGIKNKVSDMKILTKEEVREMEPNMSDKVIGALYAPTAGIICPYELTLAAAENAVDNGVELILDCAIKDINKVDNNFELNTTRGKIVSKYIINAAGLFSDDISAMAGDDSFKINPRKGEYLLLDKRQGNVVNKVIFQPPTVMGKGILVTPTVDGNLLLGPTAENILDKADISTTSIGLDRVIKGAVKSIPSVNTRDVITSFAGLRASSSVGDFVIEKSKKVDGLINVAGIESPGLSAAPAISEYVIEILKSMDIELEEKENYISTRKPVYRFREMDESERDQLIKKNPLYGNIICRCETITEGEIVDCIHRSIGASNLDAVKRRTRAGMGRCQGGFCTPRVVDIIARELNISKEQVTKMGGKSKVLVGKTK